MTRRHLDLPSPHDPDRQSIHETTGTCTFNLTPAGSCGMGTERDGHCPTCGEVRSFYRAASTRLALGPKVKWKCPECDYGFVTIGDVVDTGTTD